MRTYCAAAVLCLLSTLYSTENEIAKTSPPPPAPPPSVPAPMPILTKCAKKPMNYCDMTFELFGQWRYLQPNGSNTYYAVEAFPYNTGITVPPVSPNWQSFEIDPGYHSGLEIGSRFFFPTNDLSLEINWESLHTSDSASMDVTPQPYGTGNMVGPIFDIGPNSAVYKASRGSVNFHFDAVNLIFGRSVCFVSDLTARFYTGAGFSRIKQSTSSTYTNPSSRTSRTVSAYSIFQGAGPQFGVDFEYRLYDSLCFTGGTSLSLYMGQLKNHTTFKSNTPSLASIGVPQPNGQNTNVPHRTQVVPGFEEKLGFSYALSYDRFALTFGAGYLFQIYLNAIQSMDMTAPQVLPSLVPGVTVDMGEYAVGFARTLSNYMMTGPYLSLNVDF